MSSDFLLISAHWYARHGMAVFPLHYPVEREGKLWCTCGSRECSESTNAAKHPYGRLAPTGLLNAITDPRRIERWWGPGVPYNIGLRTGAHSGVIVIDVDPRHGGDETLMGLEERHGALPETRRHLTGSLGQHIFFRHPGRIIKNNVATALGPGLDIRGDGGYVVAPPSRHISGRYYEALTDDDTPPAELPAWLSTMMSDDRPRPHGGPVTMSESWRKLVAEGVAEGRRNDAVARLAGMLLRPGPKDPYVVLDLLHCWNRQCCRPALPDNEVTRTVESICGRELAQRQGGANAQ